MGGKGRGMWESTPRWWRELKRACSKGFWEGKCRTKQLGCTMNRSKCWRKRKYGNVERDHASKKKIVGGRAGKIGRRAKAQEE